MTLFEGVPYDLVPLSNVVGGTELRDPRKSPKATFYYVDIASVANTTFEIVKNREIVGADAPSRARKVIRQGDIIFATTRPYLKSIARVPAELDGEFCSTGFCVLRPTERILSEWLYYCAISDDFLRQIAPRMRGANYPAVTDKDVLAAKVPLPPIEEQRRIVARIMECMERVEEIDSLRTESIRQADAMLASTLNDAFMEFGEAVRKVEIGDVALETRYGTSRKCSTGPEGTVILRIPNVAGGFVNFNDLKYCSLDKEELTRIALQRGDLLFVRTNGSRDLVGRCAIFEGNGDDRSYGFASYLIRVRLDQDRMRPHFLAFFLNSTHGRKELDKRRRTSAGQYNINSENLRNIALPLPPISVQDQVVEVLRDRQAKLIRLQNDLREARCTETHLRESILRKAFAGEL